MSTFYSFGEWCDKVLHPEDTSPWDFRTLDFYNEYKTKYAIAKLVQPHTILEIGVRFGYGAHSFLLGAPGASYVGLDFDEPSWGPYEGVPRLWAEKNLHAHFPKASIVTFKCNTQKGGIPVNLPRDLVHIDADHSYNGALHDMVTFWPLTGRAMVVDDYTEIAEVRGAVQTFVAYTKGVLLLPVSSLRSSAILVRDDGQ